MVDDIRLTPEPENKNDQNIEPPKPTAEGPNVSAVDNLMMNDVGSISAGQNNKTPEKKRLHHKISELGMRIWPSTKKQKIIGSVAVVIVLIAGIAGVNALRNYFNKNDIQQSPATKQEPKTTEPSRLTGVEIPIETNKRPVTSIQIENSPDARPQSGLRDAGIVFEAIAEGGITRFNALFLEAQPDYIGPVRSIRPYYIDLFMPFDASIVHAGGSGEGLAKIQRVKAKDIDHGANADAFQRVSNRYAPHNLYTSMGALDKVNKTRGYTKSEFTSFARKKDSPAEKITARKINFSLSGFLYDPQFNYDSKTNSYLRSQAGKPHTDYKSKKPITPKVVIALEMRYSQNGIYSVYQTSGSGKMFVFQDGKVQKGTWKKKGTKDQFKFLDAEGKEIRLNAGQTWITLVTSGSVSYKP